MAEPRRILSGILPQLAAIGFVMVLGALLVKAIGLKSCPSTPCSVNSGRNTTTMMSTDHR